MSRTDVLQCPECDKLFQPHRYGQKFCRPFCRKEWHKSQIKRLLEIGRQHVGTEERPGT